MNPAQDAPITGSPVIKKTRKTVSWLEKKLKKVSVSRIELVFGEAEKFKVGSHRPDIAVPTIHINHPVKVLKQSGNGLLGWAEAYMAEDWSTPDLNQLLNWAMSNEKALEQAFAQKGAFLMVSRLLHWLNRNNKRGSRRNIAAHYDLGNDFYQLWLDSTMTYSSALFKNDNDSLEQAQIHKYQTIIDWLEMEDQHSVLEIGCGWGGLARALAGRHQKYNGITLSKEQQTYAREHSLSPTQQFSLTDYRDISGQYDRIASIEMVEAVGEQNWPVYFEKIYNSLKPGGMAVIQAILIDDQRFESYRRRVDFIQRYIFPGGMLPSSRTIREQAQKAGLHIEKKLSFGQDYARTLALWTKRFLNAWPAISKLGFDERFRRMWHFYLAYCEVGFTHKSIDVCIVKLRRPG